MQKYFQSARGRQSRPSLYRGCRPEPQPPAYFRNAWYHSGDTAFFDGFSEIGRRTGPLDLALLPIGSYEPRWFMQPQHLDPEEAVESFLALGARAFVPMHWGTFRLTDEPLGEPPRRLLASWKSRALSEDRLWMLGIGETRSLAGLRSTG